MRLGDPGLKIQPEPRYSEGCDVERLYWMSYSVTSLVFRPYCRTPRRGVNPLQFERPDVVQDADRVGKDAYRTNQR